MASDFNSIAKAIRYLGDCVRYLADKYVAVNDRVYSDWNEASRSWETLAVTMWPIMRRPLTSRASRVLGVTVT